jgi:hypothetical protein
VQGYLVAANDRLNKKELNPKPQTPNPFVQDYLVAVHDRLNKKEMADEARDEAEAMRMSKRFDVYDNLVEIARVACLDQHHRLVNLQTKAAVARNDSTQLHERYKARFLPFTHPSRCHFVLWLVFVLVYSLFELDT